MEPAVQIPAFEIKSKAVRAGAGAGKTHNLTHQVLDFALEYKAHTGAWPRVLVTTFTRKATQELSERLMKLAMTEKPGALEFVSSTQYLGVSTIHGVLDRFLKQWGHLAGLQSDYGYMKPTEAAHAAKKILKELAGQSANYGPLFSAFSFSQLRELLLESLEHDLETFSAVSEADLQKLLTSHLDYLRETLSEVLKKTAGAEASEKLQAIWGVARELRPLLDGKTWAASHERALELITSINLVGIRVKPESEIYLAHEEFKDVLKDLRELDKPVYDPAAFAHLAAINQAFARLRADFVARFAQAKQTANKIEIADLETLALKLVRQHPAAGRAFAADTDYWLIDEFQDTSPRQLQILEFLIGKKPFYLVGDPQQSIYLFRGARSEVFRDKVAELEKSGGDIDVLDKNYRSSPRLLNFINALSKDLGPQFQAMTAAKEAGAVQDAARFTIVSADDERAEAIEMECLLAQVLKLRAEGAAFDQMAVLVRKNRQLEDIGAYLTAHGVPVHLHSSGLFWVRREVQDAVALLKFFLNPFDDFNLVKLLRAPFFALTDRQLAEALREREASAWESVRDGMRAGRYGVAGAKLFGHLADAPKLGVVVVFQRALESLGFFDLHLQYDPTGRAEGNLWKFVHLLKTFERERGANLIRFVNEAERPERQDRTVDAPGSVEANKVNIMTVHAAKGLQFDYVFLPFLDRDPYVEPLRTFAVDEAAKKWSVRAPASEDEYKTSQSLFEKKVLADFRERQGEEDLRVFYVAYTRAKQQIYFSWCRPPGKNSWAAHLQRFDRESGEYTSEDFSYSVNRVEESPTIEKAAVDSAKASVPALFRDAREQAWANEPHEEHAVTKILATDMPVRRNYKNAFIKKTQGILFHKLLEIIKYPTDKDIATLVTEWFPGEEESIGEALNYALALQEPPLIDLIKTGHVEWSFRTRKTTVRDLEGQIDLWGESGGKLWIVDYKSGEKVLKDKAFQQLKAYASAVRDYLNWQGKIHLAVVYPFLQESYIEVITKDDLPF